VRVNQEGYSWFLSSSIPGSTTDSNLAEMADNHIKKNFLYPHQHIAADQGFRKLQDYDICIHIQKIPELKMKREVQ